MSDFKPPIENFLAREWRRRGYVAWALTPLRLHLRRDRRDAPRALRTRLDQAGRRRRAGGRRRQRDRRRDGQDADRDRARRGAARRRLPAGRRLARLWREGREADERHADELAAQVGDEPLLIARRTHAPVFVCPDRVAAAQALLKAHPYVDVIVSDDGLQHYRLARAFELVVFDDRLGGNGFLLPAGPLREPMSRRRDATLINSPYERTLPPWPNTFSLDLESGDAWLLDDPRRAPAACAVRGRESRRGGGHRFAGALLRDAARGGHHAGDARVPRSLLVSRQSVRRHRSRFDPDHREGCSKIRGLA